MLELLDVPPMIVFTTAYDKFAIKAFELSAIDYLLKPFSQERFNETISKAKARINSTGNNNAIKGLKDHLDTKAEALNRIVVKNRTEIKIIAIDKIIFCNFI